MNLFATFQSDFMRQALFAGLIAGGMCAYIGVYAVLKRFVFVGVALAELSAAGVALAILIGLSPMGVAVAFVAAGVALFSVRWSPRRVPNESYIGIGYAFAAALSILLIAKSAKGESQMLELLYGNVLTVSPRETLEMLGVFVVVAAIHSLFGRVFVGVSFDPDFAETLGFRARGWNLLLYLTVGVVIAYAIRSVGVLFTFGMLVLPATAALLLVNRLKSAFLLAPVLAVVPVVLGLHLSLKYDLPGSAAIVAISFALLIPAYLAHRFRHRG